MRIGLFSDSYLPTTDGIAYSIESFRQELVAQGHTVFVIAPSPSMRYKEKAPNIIRFPAVKGLFYDDYLTSVFFPPQALQKIKKLKLDIIHFHTPSQVGILGAYFALRNNTPLIATYHTDLYQYAAHYPAVLPGSVALALIAPLITRGGIAEFRQALSSVKPSRDVDKWHRTVVTRGVTQLHNHCDRVITPSQKIEKQLLSWGTTSSVRVLPTGVDRIPATAAQIKAFRKKWGLADNDKVITFVGRLGIEKHIDLLIDTFASLAAARPDAKLLLVGDNEYRQELEAHAAKSGFADRIIFTGYVPHQDLGQVYGATTVFAFPSTTDTQGLVLNEAAQAGLPIVMVDPAITEVVKDGVNGLIAKTNKRDLGKKLRTILDNRELRLQMGAASKELARNYSVKQQTKRLIKLYEGAIAAHAKADKLLPPSEAPTDKSGSNWYSSWRR